MMIYGFIKVWKLVIFLGLALMTVALCHFFPNAATNPEPGLVMWLPPNIEGHRGKEGEVSEVEKKILPPDTTKLNMRYYELDQPEELAGYRALNATLLLAGADKRSLHRPEICLDMQGWTIVGRKAVMLETKGGPLEVMRLSLIRTIDEKPPKKDWQQRAHYVYWWVSRDGSTAHSSKRQLMSALNNMFKGVNDRWGGASVLVYVDERYGDEGVKEALDRAYGFIKEYAPEFQKSLGAKDRADAKKLKAIGDPSKFKREGLFFDPEGADE